MNQDKQIDNLERLKRSSQAMLDGWKQYQDARDKDKGEYGDLSAKGWSAFSRGQMATRHALEDMRLGVKRPCPCGACAELGGVLPMADSEIPPRTL